MSAYDENARKVTMLLSESGPATAAEIAKRIGRSRPVISKLMANLVQDGLICVSDVIYTPRQQGGGTQSKVWKLCPDQKPKPTIKPIAKPKRQQEPMRGLSRIEQREAIDTMKTHPIPTPQLGIWGL